MNHFAITAKQSKRQNLINKVSFVFIHRITVTNSWPLTKIFKRKKRKEKERHHEPTVEIPDRTRIYTRAIENDPHKAWEQR